jgi:hypothetical protein
MVSLLLAAFADMRAFVHHLLWPTALFATSPKQANVIEMPRALVEHLTETTVSSFC